VRIRRAILLFGLVNARLYSALLPLWEGFDEAFHYAYVETLWQDRQFPVLGRTLIPRDVSLSFEFAPLSHVVRQTISNGTTVPQTPMSRWHRSGRVLAGCAIALWTWVLIATWTVKLFPLYSGAVAAPMRPRDLAAWYTYGARAHMGDLSLLALTPASLLNTGLIVSVLLGVALGGILVRNLAGGGARQAACSST
jgi:hypothetical protein